MKEDKENLEREMLNQQSLISELKNETENLKNSLKVSKAAASSKKTSKEGKETVDKETLKKLEFFEYLINGGFSKNRKLRDKFTNLYIPKETDYYKKDIDRGYSELISEIKALKLQNREIDKEKKSSEDESKVVKKQLEVLEAELYAI